MTDIDIVEGVLDKLAGLVEGVRPDQRDDATPCPGFTVGALVDHIVAILGGFAAGAQGGSAPAVNASDPAAAVRVLGEQVVDGWRTLGTDRDVSVTGSGPGMPGEAVLGMTAIEYVAHGTDLAIATGQAIPFTDEEFAYALAQVEVTLTDEYRGDSFGPKLPVAADAPVRDRFLAFVGRQAPSDAGR